MLCVSCRHLFLDLWYVFFGAPMLFHAGSCFLMSLDILIGAKIILCFLAVCTIFSASLGRSFELCPLVIYQQVYDVGPGRSCRRYFQVEASGFSWLVQLFQVNGRGAHVIPDKVPGDFY
ncbi:hypothetical protein BDR06DRAFT_734249 [Suillus hirtellus]|nr:hypothetical protein BDR06DRAFT_734249 [Suillus hirtellus]